MFKSLFLQYYTLSLTKKLRAKIKSSIISLIKDDINFEINSPAALKHLLILKMF